MPFARAGMLDRFELVFEVGPHGVASGGTIQLLVSPFWDWSTPHTLDPSLPGYTEIRPSDPSIELEATTLDSQLLALQVTGRALVEGDRVEIVYGAGVGAVADRYAERRSPFYFAVDGDGDGTRRFVPDPPAVDVVAGPPRHLLLSVPTIARPGETIRLTLAFVDAMHNVAPEARGEVAFFEPPAGIDLPASVSFEAVHQGRRSIDVVVREPGTYRLLAHSGDMAVRANPLIVTSEGPRVLWGDLHGHSSLSDGTGIPEDYFRYARDVSALDVAALTDHDHWGPLPLVDHPEHWDEIVRETRRFHEPGRFVTLLGYEWTSWIHGHRHVLYFEDEGELYDSVDPDFETPAQLWEALAAQGREALTFAHHSAGGPIATNWDFAPDPRFEPVTEIVSIHGSSEAPDSPDPIYDPVRGRFVRDALDRGYRLGFVGSGDRHDGHPGAYTPTPPHGGLAAIVAEEATRPAVLEALRSRRTYATNGARILLRVALGGHPMGSQVRVPNDALAATLFVQVVGQAPLDRIELVRSGAVVDALTLDGRLDVTLHREVDALEAGEYLYVRVVQQDGGAAWSSPIFLTP
jgi:hypothetical protein